MASSKSELLYWDGSNWMNARYRYWNTTPNPDVWADAVDTSSAGNYDVNPVTHVSMEHVIGNPRKAKVIIVNHPRHIDSTLANEKIGRFTGVFTDFQDVRIRDRDTGIILLAGKIYNLKESFDFVFGNSIELIIRDNLEELRNYSIAHWGNKAITGGSTLRSTIVTGLINDNRYLNSNAIAVTDATKITASTVAYAHNDTLKFKGRNKSVLSEIYTISQQEPHQTSDQPTSFGYDYYVDPAIASPLANVAPPAQAWNYFKRSTRPASAATAAEIERYGMTIKFPVGSSFAETGLIKFMHNDFGFSEPKDELYNEVVLTHFAGGSTVSGAGAIDTTKAGKQITAKTIRFERINFTGMDPTGTCTINNPDGSGTVSLAFDQAEIVAFTATDGSPSSQNFARIQYQSTVANEAGFMIVSPLDGETFDDTLFPDEAGTITGRGKTGNGSGASSVVFEVDATCRVSKSMGIKKSRMVRNSTQFDTKELRKEVASYLTENTTPIQRGNFRIHGHPYTYIDAPAANIASVSGSAVVTFQTSGTATFKDNAGTYTNDCRKFGVFPGDVIAEMDSTDTNKVTQYAYITTTAASSVTYSGGTATATYTPSTGTSSGGALDATKPMRIYIPLRAGHMIHVENTLVNQEGRHLVTELNYDEASGTSTTYLETIGENSARGGKRYDFNSKIGHDLDEANEGVETANLFDKDHWSISCVFSSTDHNTVAWAAGTLSSRDTVYSIDAGNTGDMNAGASYIIYFDPATSTTVLQSTPASSYVKNSDFLEIGEARSQTAPIKATFTPASGMSFLGDQPGLIGKGTQMISFGSIDDTLLEASMTLSTIIQTADSGERIKIDSSGVTVIGNADGDNARLNFQHTDGTNYGMIKATNWGSDITLSAYYHSGSAYVQAFALGSNIGASAAAEALVLGSLEVKDAAQVPKIYFTGVDGGSNEVEGYLQVTVSGVASFHTSAGAVTNTFSNFVQLATAVASESVPTGAFGIMRYETNAAASGADSLAFLSGQGANAPGASTHDSSFWTMYSEPETSDVSRLHLEPIIDNNSAGGEFYNYAYLGYNNALVGVNSFYHWAGAGTAAIPSISFLSDNDTGMYNPTANNVAFSANGTGVLGVCSTCIYPLINSTDGSTGFSMGTTAARWKKGWFTDIDSTNAVNVSSDRNLKENIQPTSLGLDFINDLNPISYNWKQETDDTTHYGIIAQDVVETLNKYSINSLNNFGGITYNKTTGMYGARYTEFIPILIKAIQELSIEIKELKEKK